MSTEIYLNFNTIFWTSISEKKTSIYVTNLKSRIYKAARLRMYDKMAFLQNRLIISTAAKNLALFIVLRKEQLNYQKISPYLLNFNSFDLLRMKTSQKIILSIANACKLSHCTILMLLEQSYHTLLLLALEPEIKAKQDISHYFIYLNKCDSIPSFLRNKLFGPPGDSYYLESICLIQFLKTCNINDLFVRLDASHVFQLNIGQIINNLTFRVYLDQSIDKVFSFNKINDRYPLYNLITSFLIHGLCTEVMYLRKANIYNYQDLLEQNYYACMIVVGTELLLINNSHRSIVHWNKLFNLFLLTVREVPKSLFVFPVTLYQGINFLEYWVWFEKDRRLFINPSLKSQISLMSKISLTLKKYKGDSTINLIDALNNILTPWAEYFIDTKASKIFIFLDYLIYLKLRAWIFRRHPGWGRNRTKNKYFYSNCAISEEIIFLRSHWIFYAEMNTKLLLLVNLRYFFQKNKFTIGSYLI